MRERDVLSASAVSCNRACGDKKPRRAVGALYRPSRPDALIAYSRRNYGVLDVFPVNHIVADQMSPAHYRACKTGTGRVVLIEDVIFAVEVERRVRFVHPYSGRQSVELCTVSVAFVLRRVYRNFLPFERRVSAVGTFVIERVQFVGIERTGINFHLVDKSGRHLGVDAVLVLLCDRIAEIQRFFPAPYESRKRHFAKNRFIGNFTVVREREIAVVQIYADGDMRPFV